MYYFQTLKPRLLDYIGPRTVWEHERLQDSVARFAQRVSQEEIYPALPAEQRSILSGACDHLNVWLGREARMLARRAFNREAEPADSCPDGDLTTVRDMLEAIPLRRLPDNFPGFLTRRFNNPQTKLGRILMPLYAQADRIDGDYTRELLQRTYLPRKGPLDIRELLSFLKLYQKAVVSPAAWKNTASSSIDIYFQNKAHLAAEIEFLLRDMKPLASDIRLPVDDFEITRDHVDDFLHTLPFKPEHIIALTRYYTEHHKERFTQIQLGRIERQLSRIFFFCFLMHTKSFDALDTTLAYVAQRNRKESWIEISRPALEDVTSALERTITGDNIPKRRKEIYAKFLNQRASIPAGMEEVVTLYYPESEETRKERHASFKNSNYNMREGARRRFIGSLAAMHAAELRRHYNADNHDIAYMRERHSVPAHLDITVEHITDRKAGGTNLQENMIAMPRWLNAKKEALIHAQLALLGTPDKPVWIISWHPRRNRFGDFPDLYIPEKPVPRLAITNGAACALPPGALSMAP